MAPREVGEDGEMGVPGRVEGTAREEHNSYGTERAVLMCRNQRAKGMTDTQPSHSTWFPKPAFVA